MEKLHKRSDGFAETPSGLFAVVPKYSQKPRNGVAWFSFRPSVLSEHPIRVEWPQDQHMIVIDADTAAAMVRLSFANMPDEELIEQYNAAVDEYVAKEAEADALRIAAEEKAAADQAAAEKAASDKIAADKAAADKVASDKAAADKAAADKVAAKATADKVAADKAEADKKKAK